MRLRELIVQAVEAAVAKAEPPVAVMLSGGLDSSTVAAIAAGLPAFTGWYDHTGCDEREYAKLLCTERAWTQVQIFPEDFIGAVDGVAEALGDLPCGPGAVGQWIVAQEVSRIGYKTILTGEGGDELFGGYARQHLAAGAPLPDGYENLRLPDGYPRDLPGALQVEWDALRTLCTVDERIAGAWGLNVVTPLLDPWVVAHVHSQPAEKRLGKRLLKDAMRGIVPDEILDRRDKVGFAVPFVAWAQEEPMRSFVQERIGRVPDPDEPWDRQWWYDIRELTCVAC